MTKKGLAKRNELNKSGKNETIYLKHIEEIISNKKTRAEMLIEQYNKTKKLNYYEKYYFKFYAINWIINYNECTKYKTYS